ncbi:MAG: BREX-1 system adenine-specific DNA-methyltransferase PglX [Oscillospiraceae bacterium]|nr:BREX-1 system adenine-specific DNA-methyltransferase PglX [Oscillospiraceae bacterium]
MDKNAIKKYAVWARRELIARVSQKALQYGISETDFGDAEADSINGVVLSAREKSQRISLMAKIRKDGYQQAMEEAAYTWFNRFTALRYMEVNAYLPSHVRVFTNDQNEFKPQIIDEAINLEIDGLDLDKVYEYKDANKTEELYKYLLITQCNDLGKILPGMFKKISDYTELLFPDNLLREGSVIEQMISLIPEEDWNDQVQIIGWLYQYYISEPKDELINAHKAYKDNEIKYVTQIFTSDWIVRFMVENSLGRLWKEGHGIPDDTKWDYYLDEREKTEMPADMKNYYENIKPEEITFFDPCMGSGHILVYAFDVLISIYCSQGYSEREAASLIIQKNLYGLDIDDRAYQLSYFSLMMKARQYDRRFFTREITPNIACFKGLENSADAIVDGKISELVAQFKNCDSYGSLMSFSEVNGIEQESDSFEGVIGFEKNQLDSVLRVYKILSQKYDIVCTNPPYMNSTYMPNVLKQFIQDNYSDYKSDLFAAFIVKAITLTKENGYIGFLTPYVWWFISTYEKLRSYVYNNTVFKSIVQLEYNAFEGACVPVGTFVLQKTINLSSCECIKLSDFKGTELQSPKTLEAINDLNCNYRFTSRQENFSKIPGSPVAYWVSENFFRIFENSSLLNEYSVIFEGLKTRDKEKFVRLWFEIGDEKWKPYSKGGSFRRWYGNKEYVVKWGEDGTEIRNFKKSSGSNFKYYYRPTVTYSALTSYKFSGRYLENSFFGGGGGGITNTELVKYILGYVNSKVYHYIINAISPTLNFEVGQIGSQPFILNKLQQSKIEEVVQDNISLSKTDWDSFETSWDFVKHPFLVMNEKQKETHNEIVNRIEYSYGLWDAFTKIQFQILKHNEEELNRIFIDIYGLQDELTPEVEDKDVTVRKADLTRDIKSFISYAVGCMFGRYSLDVDGLAFAGGEWDNAKYKSFIPSEHNIIPISDDEYFKDDITERFIAFVKTVYGEETLEENLKFIADALGGKGSPREIIRKYFINDFFADHCKIYQKRPIYWLFDSGKKNGFKALIYMHRYQPDTIARIRTDYVHEQQNRYRTAISDIEQRMSAASTSERVKLTKELRKLNEQADELLAYEEKIHHLADQMISIDLDDGVKNNYEIFKDVLAKIK